MRNKKSTLYFIAGLWCSLLALTIGAGFILPDGKDVLNGSPALMYSTLSGDVIPQPSKTPDKGKVIVADLSLMQLTLYENGELLRSLPILSRGKVGTPWETPTGKYLISTKEKRHYSSIGGTWMPYSMQFYGNFFIHGWPTYDSGDDVPIGYSGGCIRLATLDAKVVYEFAPKGTKLIVIGVDTKDAFATSSDYTLRGESEAPRLTSQSFIVSDLDSGRVLWEEGGETPKHPRGLIALPVALTALETVNQYKIVRVSELLLGKAVLRKNSINGSDEVPAGALIYPLLFGSNNTAAKVFAKEHGTKQFVKFMNDKASAVGMSMTDFGGVLSTDNSTTTPRDMLSLLTYVNRSKRFLINVTLSDSQHISSGGGDGKLLWENRNPWVVLHDGEFRGGISEVYSDGGGNAMMLFDLSVSEFSRRTIAFVVLDSRDLKGDIAAMRLFVTSHFVYGTARTPGALVQKLDDTPPTLMDKVKALFNADGVLEYASPRQRGA